MNLSHILVLICLIMIISASAFGADNVKPIVGVYYFPGWYRGQPGMDAQHQWSEWRDCIIKCPHPRPLCGFYDDSNPKLWNYYAKWMASHGIDFISFDWYYNSGQLYLNDSLDKGFLGCKKSDSLKFVLHWCNHGGNWWKQPLDQTRPALMDMIDLACERYFKRADYLKINGKPVFMIYDTDILSQFGTADELKANLRAMRGRAVKHGLPGLYIVGVYGGTSAAYVDRYKNLGYDAFCAYTYVGMRHWPVKWDSKNIPYKTGVKNCVENIYPFLSRIAKDKGIDYWPVAFSGWDDRPRAGTEKAYITDGTNPELFGKMLTGAIKYANPKSPIVLIEAWNEWGEGACMEPSKEFGFGYLQEIAKATCKHRVETPVPSAEEIASWNILTDEELKTAKDNEKIPWDPPAPIYIKTGKSRQVPNAKMPVTVDFGVSRVSIQTPGCEVEKRDNNGLVLVVKDVNPQVIFDLPETPTAQIKQITLECEVPNNSIKLPYFEFYYTTSQLPEFTPFCSAHFPPLSKGTTSIETADIMSWEKSGTPVVSFRIDFRLPAGTRLILNRLVLEGK